MRDLKSKDGYTILGAEPNERLQVLFNALKWKYFDDLREVPLYLCDKIIVPEGDGEVWAITVYPGDVEDMGCAIFVVSPLQGHLTAQNVLHEMVHVQLGQEVGHKPEFWRLLREKWAMDWQWLAGLTGDWYPTFPSEIEWDNARIARKQ